MDAAFSRLTMTAASAMLLLALVVLWRRHVSAYITAFRTQSVVLARCYDQGGFTEKVDYKRDPLATLRSQDRQWLAELLKQQKLR